jgi:hypothetical protein
MPFVGEQSLGLATWIPCMATNILRKASIPVAVARVCCIIWRGDRLQCSRFLVTVQGL